jgi:AraC-like DNA-binding protein
VGLSRSAFAARFSELVGQPVAEYLTQWRIALATTRLRQGGASIAEIGFDVGYGSEAAFSRAFKRVTGVTPGSIRQTS